MKSALIIYHSRTGITRRYAENIGAYLSSAGVEVQILSIQEYTPETLPGKDYLFLGCWTSGLFFFLQHPDKAWKEFVSKLPARIESKIAFFTTFKLLTGSMFRNMLAGLWGRISSIPLEFKSKNGSLSEGDKERLNRLINPEPMLQDK
jgi:flavodoxin